MRRSLRSRGCPIPGDGHGPRRAGAAPAASPTRGCARQGSAGTHSPLGNEPDIHAAYLFAVAGRPELTAYWLDWIRATLYRTDVEGLPGNDDAGTLSAFYIFSALGFYPLAGSDRYVIGKPLFPRAEVHLPGGTFVVEADGLASENGVVTGVTLDGAAVTGPYLRHADLAAGRVLRFSLAPGAETRRPRGR